MAVDQRPGSRRGATLVVALACCVGALSACELHKLLETQPGHALRVVPEVVGDSAAVGSAARRAATLSVTATEGGPPGWTARRSGAETWLTLVNTSGPAPGTLRLSLDPAGLDPGPHRDTVLVEPSEGTWPAVRVPVEFRVHPCIVTAVAPPVEVAGELRDSDCAAPHREGAFGRLYGFTAGANDSVSLVLRSPEFDGFLVLGRAGEAPLGAAEDCPGTAGDACLWYVQLPASGSYVVEVTSAGSQDTGGFTLQLAGPRAPGPPPSLGQFAADSATPIPVGESSGDRTVVLAATASDPDAPDSLELEIEVKRVSQDFTGQETHVGARVANGARALVRVTGLSDEASYHWRARVHDATGRIGPWQSFGDNAESTADFRVAVTASRLVFARQPTTATAGSAIAPAVEVRAVDAEGNPAPGFTGTVVVSLAENPADGTLSGTRSVSASGGVATFSDLTINRAGDGYRLSASAAGVNGAVSDRFDINPGPAARLVFTAQPSATPQNERITPPVRVTAEDLHGNAATGYTGAVTVAIGRDGSPLQNARLSGGGPVAAAAGVATFADLRIDQVGIGYTLTAAAAGLTGATSASFDVTAPAPPPPPPPSATGLVFTVQPSNARPGVTISPPVQVTAVDDEGARVAGFTGPITIAIGRDGSLVGNAQLHGTRTVNAVDGVAVFGNLRINQVGFGYTLTAAFSGNPPSATSRPFNVFLSGS